MINFDDNDLAIVAIFLLGIGSFFVLQETTVLLTIVATIAALAKGKKKDE